MTMDTAGKAVLFSGVTVLISLSAVMLVPSPAFRSTSLGIMLSVVFVLAAALTLLPAVLAKLGPRLDRFALPWVHAGEHHSPRSAAWAERLWRRPLPYGLAAIVLLVALALPVLTLKTGMPSITVVPSGDHSREGYSALQQAFGPGRRGRCRSSCRAPRRAGCSGGASAIRASRACCRRSPAAEASRSCRRSRRRTRRRRHGADDRPSARGVAADGARRWRGGREPRPRGGAGGHDAAGDRRRARPQLPAADDRAPGAADRRARRPHEPARDRRRLRRREADLPGRHRALAARLRAAGLPRRVGAGVLLRDDLRDLDGLHRVPAVLGEGALGAHGRGPQGGDGRRHGLLRARDLRGRRGDGRRVLHVRAQRPAAAEGDGRDPRRRRAARRRGRPAAAGAGAAATARQVGVVRCPSRSAGCCPTSASATRDRPVLFVAIVSAVEDLSHEAPLVSPRRCSPAAAGRRARPSGGRSSPRSSSAPRWPRCGSARDLRRRRVSARPAHHGRRRALRHRADRWRARAPMPARLNHAAAAVYKGDLYVVGGYADGNVGRPGCSATTRAATAGRGCRRCRPRAARSPPA